MPHRSGAFFTQRTPLLSRGWRGRVRGAAVLRDLMRGSCEPTGAAAGLWIRTARRAGHSAPALSGCAACHSAATTRLGRGSSLRCAGTVIVPWRLGLGRRDARRCEQSGASEKCKMLSHVILSFGYYMRSTCPLAHRSVLSFSVFSEQRKSSAGRGGAGVS